jgi:hypothetical protein
VPQEKKKGDISKIYKRKEIIKVKIEINAMEARQNN